jgi:hypothetical protein
VDPWPVDSDDENELDDDELDNEFDPELDDRLGSIEVREENNEVVVVRSEKYGARASAEMLRFDRVEKVLRIFPKVTRSGEFEDEFDRIAELQVEAPAWHPNRHSAEDERYGLLFALGLPKGFAKFYEYGLGIKRDYRRFVDEIEEHSSCTVVRFILAGEEGLDADGATFRVSLQRFEDYRAVVDRSRARGRSAVNRVIAAECHNALADLFHLDRVEPRYARNNVIRALTEEVATGHVMDESDRATLVEQVAIVAPKFAQESPERFGRLRQDIELVSLKVLIDRFEEGLEGPHASDESHWQSFFEVNRFALQQVFSMPIVVASTCPSGRHRRTRVTYCRLPVHERCDPDRRRGRNQDTRHQAHGRQTVPWPRHC